MFTNLRKLPASSVNRAPRPGYWRSRSVIKSATVPVVATTDSFSFVSFLRGVGMSTFTGILSPFLSRNGRQKLFSGKRCIERGQICLDVSRPSKLIRHGFLRLQAVARDRKYDDIVRRES